MANPLCAPIKKTLSAKYGRKNIKVRNGTGTAWGWVEISVTAEQKEFIVCPSHTLVGYQADCLHCVRASEHVTENEVRLLAAMALERENLKLYSYTTDDGRDRDCILISIFYKK